MAGNNNLTSHMPKMVFQFKFQTVLEFKLILPCVDCLSQKASKNNGCTCVYVLCRPGVAGISCPVKEGKPVATIGENSEPGGRLVAKQQTIAINRQNF